MCDKRVHDEVQLLILRPSEVLEMTQAFDCTGQNYVQRRRQAQVGRLDRFAGARTVFALTRGLGSGGGPYRWQEIFNPMSPGAECVKPFVGRVLEDSYLLREGGGNTECDTSLRLVLIYRDATRRTGAC